MLSASSALFSTAEGCQSEGNLQYNHFIIKVTHIRAHTQVPSAYTSTFDRARFLVLSEECQSKENLQKRTLSSVYTTQKVRHFDFWPKRVKFLIRSRRLQQGGSFDTVRLFGFFSQKGNKRHTHPCPRARTSSEWASASTSSVACQSRLPHERRPCRCQLQSRRADSPDGAPRSSGVTTLINAHTAQTRGRRHISSRLLFTAISPQLRIPMEASPRQNETSPL